MEKVLAAAAGDPAGLAARMCAALADGLSAAGAGMSLLPDTTARQLLCASTAEALRLEELQFETAEGPCVTAARTGRPVVVADLTHEVTAWPVFGTLVREQLPGVQAIHAFPLALAGRVLGCADVFFHRPTPLDPVLHARATAATTVITATLLRAYADLPTSLEGDAPWESGPQASTHWTSAYHAVGVLAERLHISADEALARIRAQAFRTGEPLPQIAAQLLADAGGTPE
ncbi:GAF and ANTAR domain-containing protein [Streptomyces sp. NBC_00237]|uniref:GAF and ANTAR domain-containing protein n=1 Tax=Streptomyces sp. NBC_00237 TaxID=2975687 RepID=UPI00224E4D26|nr:GAF and ANTAR domain-containing protein [Streptomyces sp. NBC_00237]MCX5205755.1 GAF and ANTAR domain-containing protein [Streptomyces sp. NBC_00237]